MDFMALHLKVLPWIRLRKDRENVSNIFHWDDLAPASLHLFPSRIPAQTHLFVLPKPLGHHPNIPVSAGNGKKGEVWGKLSSGSTRNYAGKFWDTNLWIHNCPWGQGGAQGMLKAAQDTQNSQAGHKGGPAHP